MRRLRTKERRRKRALRPNWWLRLILYRPARLDTQVVGPAAAYPRHVTYDTAMSRRITSVWTRCPQLVLLGAFPCNLARWKNVSRAFFLAGFALIQPLRQQHNIDAVGGGGRRGASSDVWPRLHSGAINMARTMTSIAGLGRFALASFAQSLVKPPITKAFVRLVTMVVC